MPKNHELRALDTVLGVSRANDNVDGINPKPTGAHGDDDVVEI